MNLDKFKNKRGHFIETVDGIHIFKIGKYKGIDVEKVYDDDEAYIEWVYDATDNKFDQEVIDSITNF